MRTPDTALRQPAPKTGANLNLAHTNMAVKATLGAESAPAGALKQCAAYSLGLT